MSHRGAHFQGGAASDGHRRGGPDGLDPAGGAARRRAFGTERHPDGLRHGRGASAGDASPVGAVERQTGDRQRPRASTQRHRARRRHSAMYVQRQGGDRRQREGRRQGIPRQKYIPALFYLAAWVNSCLADHSSGPGRAIVPICLCVRACLYVCPESGFCDTATPPFIHSL